MQWAAIIQLIITILTTIMEWLGGGIMPKTNILTSDVKPVYHLVDRQWQCGQPYWTTAPGVNGGRFTGTVALDCNVEGVAGGGIQQLRSHIASDMVNTAATIENQMVETLDGLPSISHEVEVVIEHAGQQHSLRGKSQLASNGFTHLRHVFSATRIPGDTDLKYLKGMSDEVQVTTTNRDGWYQIHMTYSPDIEKPWFVGAGVFKSSLVEKCEERMQERKERVVNDLASHL
jgi:hypothetical protein